MAKAKKKVIKKKIAKKVVKKKKAKKVVKKKVSKKKEAAKLSKKSVAKSKQKDSVDTPSILSSQFLGELDNLTSKDSVVLTDSDGFQFCEVSGCDQIVIAHKWCRLHFLMKWEAPYMIHAVSEKILGKYIKDLTSGYSKEYVEHLLTVVSNVKKLSKFAK